MKKIIDKIIQWLAHWPKDKVMHFALSFVIAIIAGCFMKICGGDKWDITAAAWFAGFFAGVIKEVYDEYRHGDSDEKDWAADVVGTTLGTIVALILAA